MTCICEWHFSGSGFAIILKTPVGITLEIHLLPLKDVFIALKKRILFQFYDNLSKINDL